MPVIEAFGKSYNTDNITTFHKVLIGGVAAALIVFGGGYQMVYPKWDNLQMLEEEIVQQQSEIEKKEIQAKNLDKLKEELKVVQASLVALRRKIPTTANESPLLLDVEEITENKALYGNSAVLNTFKPGGIVDFTLPAELQSASDSPAAKQLKQLPVQIQLSKMSYPELIEMLQDLENYERTLSIESLTISPQEDPQALYTPVNVSFTLKAFLIGGAS